jgi:hypothetical protein
MDIRTKPGVREGSDGGGIEHDHLVFCLSDLFTTRELALVSERPIARS